MDPPLGNKMLSAQVQATVTCSDLQDCGKPLLKVEPVVSGCPPSRLRLVSLLRSSALWCHAHCERDMPHYKESSRYLIPSVIVVPLQPHLRL